MRREMKMRENGIQVAVVVLAAAALLSGGVSAAAVAVRVDPGQVKARVPRTLYGTGMEDVNHEIYGGLDAQRLYDESFEETLPPQRHNRKENDGHRTCGRQWENVLSGGGTTRQDDAVRHLGARSQALAPNGGSAGVANRGLNGWGVPCRAGRRMRGWLFARGRVDSLEVALQRDDGRVTYATNAVPFAGTDDWTRIDFALTPDRTDPQGRFLVRAAGRGEVWIDDVYLADEPTNEFGCLGCREDIVEGLRREGLTFLRWGGTMVNTPGYSLVNAVGDRRPYRGFWFTNSSTGFHIREFVRLSAALGLPCAFSVHTYEDTAAAAELARWTRQFDIDMCVEIGNEEVTGWGDDPGAKTDIPTCRRYAESVRRIAAAMRRENPRLRFASATMFQPKHMDVMEESFRLTDGVVDCWDLHLCATDDPRKSYESAKETLGTCRDMFRRLNPKTTMKVAVFEENGWEHGQRRALSHAAVLAAVREFGDFVLTSCPANALQAWGQNDSGWDQGQVFYTTDRVWLQPCGWAQQMASAFHRGLLVASSCDDEDLIVSATKDEEGRSVVLHVVNTRGVGKKLELAIAGAKWRIAKAVSLSSPDPQADNLPDDPERISPKDVTESIRSSMTVEPYSYTVIECLLASGGGADDQG